MTLEAPAAKSADALGPKFNIITKAISGGPDDSGKRRFRATASSTIIDTDGDEITLPALEKMAQKFRQGVTIFMDHDFKHVDSAYGLTDGAEIISRSVDDKGVQVWDLDIMGVVNTPNPRAVQLADSIDGGFVKLGASVTARVRKHARNAAGGMRINDLDVVEASIVGVPANQRSWAHKAAVAIKSFHADQEEIMGDETHDDSIDEDITKTDQGLAEKIEPVTEAVAVEATPETGDDAAEQPAAEEASGVQESVAETPETAPTDEEHEADPLEVKAASFAPEDVAELVSKARGLVEEIGRQREEIARLTALIETQKQSHETVSTEVGLAKEVISKVMATPLQPKTAAYVESFTTAHSLFAPEVTEYLTKRGATNK